MIQEHGHQKAAAAGLKWRNPENHRGTEARRSTQRETVLTPPCLHVCVVFSRLLGFILLGLLLLVVAFAVRRGVQADEGMNEQGQVYSTWEGLEADKCASIWVIRRFVDKQARFRFFPKGAFIQEGIPFDTPTSELRRDSRQAVFGKILAKYNINDPVLRDIDKIIWDIEVNTWEKKVTKEAEGVNAVVQGLILSTEDENQCLEKTDVVFDGLYAYLKARRQAGNE